MSPEFSRPSEIMRSEPAGPKYEPMLWAYAEELADLRAPLTDYQDQLCDQIADMQSRSLNLHEKEQLGKKEVEYLRIAEKLQNIETQETRVEQALEALEEGTLTVDVAEKLLPKKDEDTKETSKRKKRIQEEKERLGIDPREVAVDIHNEFGSNARSLTTGRHRSRVTGNIDPYAAKDVFDYYATDTHGGKVGYGKKGNNRYVTRGGKKIRKR